MLRNRFSQKNEKGIEGGLAALKLVVKHIGIKFDIIIKNFIIKIMMSALQH